MSRRTKPSMVNHTRGGQALGASHCCVESKVVVRMPPAWCRPLLTKLSRVSILESRLQPSINPAHMGMKEEMDVTPLVFSCPEVRL